MASPSSEIAAASFAVTSVAAVLEWRSPDDQAAQYIGSRGASGSCRVALDVGVDATHKKFKLDLRVPIDIKGLSKSTNIHILVQPEHITSLLCERSSMASAPHRVRTTFVQRKESASNRSLIIMTCETKRAITLIGPSKQFDMTPSTRKTKEILDKVQTFLNDTTTFKIYTSGEVFLDEQLQSMSRLATNSTSDMLPLKRMYGGRSGRILAKEDFDTSPPYDPPSYDEIGPTPSPPEKRGKRKQNVAGLSSAPILSEKRVKLTDQLELESLKDEVAMLRSEIKVLRSQKAELLSTTGTQAAETISGAQRPDADITRTTEYPRTTENTETSQPHLEDFTRRLDALDNRLSDVDHRHSTAVSQLEASFAGMMKEAEERFEERLKQTEERFNVRLEESETRSKVALEQAKADVDDAVRMADLRWGEKLAGEKRDLRESVKDEIRNVDERLKQTDERLNDRFEESEQWFEKRSEAVLEQAKADADDIVWSADLRWDEQLAGEKEELRDFVKEEMKNVEDGIKDDLRHGRAKITVAWD
ncbi:hypothetical protein K490DRAFT_61639 [Saccharata proteae CBS 121410]|uniref:Uncharacterized protein n=1 Tax=Saccharata proteae CBS 121410 TaxID=1314787 RepID=A0A9P4I2W8_9PEZI|nr:hypothetical protein K490DRAFT_61639 [Saccharata proteae CBS 121410]